jgi:ribulose-phosphate 3-epimerase
MCAICPTVTAYSTHEYRVQIEQLKPFAERIHIDLMDGDFAPVKSPEMSEIWWPHHLVADIHVMYRRPMDYLGDLIRLKPHMVIVQAEAEVHHMHFAAELHRHNILTGLCILQETPVDNIKQIMHSFDQVLVFSGNLGYQGGSAVDFGLLHKVKEIKDYYPEIEVAWDGGINDTNARELLEGGVRVLNVGGFVQKSDNPEKAYATLKTLVKDFERDK